MKHATVRLGEYEIPLVGIPVSSTEGLCAACGKKFYILDLRLDGHARPTCFKCLEKNPELAAL